MATKVHMEALSPTMEEGQVVKWLKSEGDGVTSGEIIAEIETDKATMELTARGDGVLRAILVGEGGTAPVGDVIALIGAVDEDISELQAASLAASGGNGVGAGEGEGGGAPSDAELAARTDVAAGEAPASGSDSAIDRRIKASPLARRLATESGVELSRMSGSGPAGRIVKRDIEAAIAAGTAAPISTAPTSTLPVLVPSGAEFEDVPLSQMRKTIARRLTESIGPVPHFFLTIEVDMGRAMDARRTINAML